MTAGDVVDRTVVEVGEHVQAVLQREATARREGFLQAVTPTVTLLGVLALLVLTVFQSRLRPLSVLGIVAVCLAVASGLGGREFLARTLPVPAMAAVVIAPRAVLVPGDALLGPITAAGAETVAVFVARVFVSVALVALLLSTTRFADLLGALERLHVPGVAVTLVAITHRYLLVLFAELTRSVRARRSRQIQPRSLGQGWRETGSLLGSFFVRTLERGEAVQRAARARGGPGTGGYRAVERIGTADYVFVAVVVVTTALTIGVGL